MSRWYNRLRRLEALGAEANGHFGGRTRSLRGLETDAILDAVEAAVSPDDDELYERLWDHVEVADDQGDTHYFLHWVWGLQEGSWALPVPMPRAVLEGFDRNCGCTLFRCETCKTGLGNARYYAACPTCGASRDRISMKKLSGPPWDPLWVYTPLPKVTRPGVWADA